MEIADLQHGKILTLDAAPVTPMGLEKFPRDRQAFALSRLGDFYALVFSGQPVPLLVHVPDANYARELNLLIERNAPLLCWLVQVRSTRNQVQSLTIQIHEFSERISPFDLVVGVDEKFIVDMERQLARRLSVEAATAWLSKQLLIVGPEPGQPERMLLVGRPNAANQPTGSFRILGDRYALDIQSQTEGPRLATRLTRPRTALTPEAYRPIFLVEGNIKFVDQTVAAKMRQNIATELDEIVRAGDSYLGIWLDYQSLEAKRILEDARRFGFLNYDSCTRLTDGRWSFHLTTAWTPVQLFEGPNGDKNFETSLEVPEILVGASPPDDQWWNSQATQPKRARSYFRGSWAGSNESSILLRPTEGGDPVPPPEKGFIHISLRGDLTIMDRRVKAHARIVNGQGTIPQLRLLLENRPVPTQRVQVHEPLSAAAKAKFHKSGPTPRQVEAIRVALNTPDIAVIQGPPGTGKTRTISAIIERFSEIAQEQDKRFDRVLLTSFQHDAVENAAAMTQIFGLPATKIGRRRGEVSENLPVTEWMRLTAAHLEADLAARPRKPLRKLLEAVRIRHAAYVQSPGTDQEAARMLLDLVALTGPHLSAILSDRITSVADRLKMGVTGLDEPSEEMIRVVRGLRIQPQSFGDDGPRMAWRVQDKLSCGKWLSEADHELLKQAITWKSPLPLDFLPALEQLKDRLLDALQSATPPSRVPLVNAEVVTVLDDMVTSIDASIRIDVEAGPDAAVEDLIQDVKNDPGGAHEAVARYTAVLAATCQQAVSSRMLEMLSDDIQFDNVIVDEAARANPLDLLIPMSCASQRIILVGDHRQLPHLLEPEVERQLESSVREETRNQIRRSLFERLFLHVKNLEKRDGVKRWVTLDTQYRMHPVLGAFVSDAFYKEHNESFFSPSDPEINSRFVHSLTGPYADKIAAWKNLPPAAGAEERAGYSWRRICEADWIAAEARRLLNESPGLSVGIISFYTAQVEAIKGALDRQELMTRVEDGSLAVAEAWRTTVNAQGETCERLRVGTVDAFQGKEFDIVILSLTRSNRFKTNDEKSLRRKFGHLLLENRLCVAMSRQKRLLITVGDVAMAAEEFSKSVHGLNAFHKLCQSEHGIIF